MTVLGDVSAAGVAALIAAVALAILTGGLLVGMVSLTRTLRGVREATEELRRAAVPLVQDAHSAVAQANAELERVDGLLTTAESISTTVDSASRLAYLAFSNPVVKALAFGAGTARAARRLRKPSARPVPSRVTRVLPAELADHERRPRRAIGRKRAS